MQNQDDRKTTVENESEINRRAHDVLPDLAQDIAVYCASFT